MADEHANPSRDPANDDSLLGFARQILDKFLQGVDDMLPARVVKYDRATNRAVVVPMVKLLTTDNRQITRAQFASVPVLQLGGGGFVLSTNLKAGDLGWLKANDRDISLVLQAYRDNAPNTLRKHSFADAVFIPDAMRGITTSAGESDNFTLQSLDGSVRVSLGAASVNIVAPGASIKLSAAGVEMTGPVKINGVTFNSHVHGTSPGPSNP